MTYNSSFLIGTAALVCAHLAQAQMANEILIIESEEDELQLIEEHKYENKMLDFKDAEASEVPNAHPELATTMASSVDIPNRDKPLFKVDEFWAEVGYLGDSNATTETQGYLHGTASFKWQSERWEVKLSARADGYFEHGDSDFEDLGLDYDENYIRYHTNQSALTIGSQKIIWGRIDEIPPTDRLSTQDLRRTVFDDLEYRRLASPSIRYERFFGDSKLDLVAYPTFREAQLPDHNSAWYPVNKQTGDVLGLVTEPLMESVIKTTPIKENTPSSEGGLAARFTSIGQVGDYGVTLQKGRQNAPYFAFNPATNTLEGRYPRSWMIGADIAFEALGGTLKLEGNWLSDTPITRIDGLYDQTESITWGIALELFPGDGDARLNLQLTGQNLINAPHTIDRDEVYSFNGTLESTFAHNNWRAQVRFYLGLDDKDIYLNPEIAYTGLEAQEIYLELHYLDGDEGTAGGFYKDNSLAALGWRADL